MSVNYTPPSAAAASLINQSKVAITTADLIAGYTSPTLDGLVICMRITVEDNNATWGLNPKVFRYFWDTTIGNSINMNVPNGISQNFSQTFTPDAITGGLAGALYANTYSSFFTIQANPALLGISVLVEYLWWDI
jgi:hypothetical protein